MIQDYVDGWKEGASGAERTRPVVLVVVVGLMVEDGKVVADVVVEVDTYAVGDAFAAGEGVAWKEYACAIVEEEVDEADEAAEGALVLVKRNKA